MAEHKTVKARLNELKSLPESELAITVEAARRNIYNLRRQKISKPIENVKAIRTSRKEIARVFTILRQREIAATKQNAQ